MPSQKSGRPPSSSFPKRRPPKSEYGRQLEEKQKTRDMYCLSERQFRTYVKKAGEKKNVDPKVFLFESLEKRLDSIVYRLGLSRFSRKLSRQLVTHGHIMINGKRMNIPSYCVSEGDEISLRKQSRETSLFKEILKTNIEEKTNPPSWLVFDYQKGEGKIKGVPGLQESGVVLDLTSVMEFYSR